jgi:hypothetical protein
VTAFLPKGSRLSQVLDTYGFFISYMTLFFNMSALFIRFAEQQEKIVRHQGIKSEGIARQK